MPDLFPDYLVVLLATLVLELPVVLWLGGKRALPDGLLANLLTHPIAVALWAIGMPFGFDLWWAFYERAGHGLTRVCELGLVELLVVAVELLIFRLVTRISWRRAAAMALLANLLSLVASPDVLRWLMHAVRW